MDNENSRMKSNEAPSRRGSTNPQNRTISSRKQRRIIICQDTIIDLRDEMAYHSMAASASLEVLKARSPHFHSHDERERLLEAVSAHGRGQAEVTRVENELRGLEEELRRLRGSLYA